MTDEALAYNRGRYNREETREIQRALGVTADGVWGPRTMEAVLSFQRANRLKVDGKIGPLTHGVLMSMSKEPPKEEMRSLTDEEVSILMWPTAKHESGGAKNPYGASNLDAEFEGWFDHPRREPRTNRVLRPQERADYRRSHLKEGHKAFWASKWGDDGALKSGGEAGTHIGRSEGFIQFAQSPGSLGRYLREAMRLDGEQFRSVMGKDADELVRVTNAGAGESRVIPSLSAGLRNNRVMPVGGHDLWRGPWNERFDALAEIELGKQAQRNIARADYLVPALDICREYGWSTQQEIGVVFDMCVQFGPGSETGTKGARPLLKRALRAYGVSSTLLKRLEILNREARERRLKIASELSSRVRYTW